MTVLRSEAGASKLGETELKLRPTLRATSHCKRPGGALGQLASFETWRHYSLVPPLYSLMVLLPRYEDESLISWLACFAAFFAWVLLSEVGLRA